MYVKRWYSSENTIDFSQNFVLFYTLYMVWTIQKKAAAIPRCIHFGLTADLGDRKRAYSILSPRAQNNKKPIKDFLAVLSTGGLKHICSSNQGNRIPLVNSSGTLPPKKTAKAPENWWPKKTSLSFWSKRPKSVPLTSYQRGLVTPNKESPNYTLRIFVRTLRI